MVYFEKMVLHGFKSFSKPTTIPLYKGFNAVIGPNGSGKSNLADAIVFVLGSTSRALRAGRLDHVIYNGGQFICRGAVHPSAGLCPKKDQHPHYDSTFRTF